MTVAHSESTGHQPPVAYRAYFTEFLPKIIGQLLLEDLHSLSCCFEILVSEAPCEPWRLQIESGRLVYVGLEGLDPQCRFTLDARTLLDVISAGVAPQEAFFGKRIELSGDMELGLKLSTVLEPFFKRYAFQCP